MYSPGFFADAAASEHARWFSTHQGVNNANGRFDPGQEAMRKALNLAVIAMTKTRLAA